jgi:asparagine synthase (glutamine-hydrolysing)
MDGGRYRAVARRAFAQDVPEEIINRFWKGGSERHIKAFLAFNMAFIRELLMDGLLVRERILDRSKVEEAVSGLPSRSSGHTLELFSHVCTEAWLQHWEVRRQRAVAA